MRKINLLKDPRAARLIAHMLGKEVEPLRWIYAARRSRSKYYQYLALVYGDYRGPLQKKYKRVVYVTRHLYYDQKWSEEERHGWQTDYISKRDAWRALAEKRNAVLEGRRKG